MDGFILDPVERSVVIHLHPAAPAKPPVGAACNGCGVCCATEPCPAGMVASGHRRGACALLQWSDSDSRYRCGAMMRGPSWWRAMVRRWVAAGRGCDAALETRRG